MKTKTKIMAFVSLISLTLILLMVGVWALKTIDFAVGGNLSYVAPGVEATISKGTLTNGVWENAGDASNKMPQTQITKNDTEETLTTKFSYWQNLNILFNEAGDDVKISFTITNDSAKKYLIINVSSSTTSLNNATISVNTTSAVINPTKSQQFEITMTITDKTQNASLTNFAVVFHMEIVDEIVPDASEFNYLSFVYNDNDMTATITEAMPSTPAVVNFPSKISKDGKTYTLTCISGFMGGFDRASSLTEIIIPDSVKIIDGSAFSYCSNLTKVTLGDGLQYLQQDTFGESLIENYTTYQNGKYIGSANNPYMALIEPTSDDITTMTIHDDCKFFLYNFWSMSNLNFTTYDNGKYIGTASNPYYLLAGSSSFDIKSVQIHPNCKVIGPRAFEEMLELNFSMPDGVKQICSDAFGGIMKYTGSTLTLPNSVEIIEGGALSFLSSINTMTFGSNVKFIDSSAFSYLTFKTFCITASIPPQIIGAGFYSNDLFAGNSSLTTIQVPSQSLQAYKTADGWKDYASLMVGV